MNTGKALLELEELLEQQGFRIRKEKGNFKGDSCVLMGEKVIVLNKMTPPQIQVGVLTQVIQSLNIDESFVKPSVRKWLNETASSVSSPQNNKGFFEG